MNSLSRQRRNDAGRARVFSAQVVTQIHALIYAPRRVNCKQCGVRVE